MAKRRTAKTNNTEKITPKKPSGIVKPEVKTGKVDPRKTIIASKQEKMEKIASGYASGMFRESGMMMTNMPTASGTWGSGSLPAFRTSYASGNTMVGGGTTDIPPYFQLMNDKNGGLIYWPVSLREKYDWYRYFARCIFLSDNDLGLVSMADGTLKSIKDVQIGDEVITGKGTIRKVKEKFERRCIEDKAVTIKSHCLQNSLKTTHHHPYYILRKEYAKDESGRLIENKEFKPEWVNAEEVNVGDYVLMAPVVSDPNSNISKEEARLLGYYAAEGSLVWSKRCVNTNKEGSGYKWGQEKIKVPVGISFTIHEKEESTIGEDILTLGEKVFGRRGITCHRRRNSVEIRIAGREIGEFCNKHVGVGSATKTLSQELLMASNDAREQFIVGYMNGDGHQYDNSTTNGGKILIGTASDNLASQVQLMAISCGIMCRIAKYKRSENCKTGYMSDTDQWHITIPSWCANKIVKSSVRFNERKYIGKYKRSAFFVNGYAAFQVKEIKYSQEDDIVYNIEVDAEGDEKSYICNGMITHNTDAYIGRGLELLADLPMSKIQLNMPKMEKKPKKLKEEIYAFFNDMCANLGLFKRLQEILWEYNLIGNSFIYHEYNSKKKTWDRIVILPPEEVTAFQYPFQDNARIEYRPEKLMQIIKMSTDSGLDGDPMAQEIMNGIPKEVVDMVNEQGCIVMDSVPVIDGNVGSFVHHMARRRSPYLDLGASVLERVLVPMLMKEHYRYTQLGLASRNMTPKNKVSAPGLTQPELDDLRMQLDLSYMDPEYSIVTNYEWDWDQIGSDARLMDLNGEYETIENQVFAAMGVTRDLITGEGSWSGGRVTVEIINTMFLLTREMLREYVENQLFKPIALARGWFDEDKNGVRDYWYPHLGFNRLSIRDNAEVFDSLFQLYQKGSLPVDVIYELFNLDSDSLHEKLKEECFTIKDSTFNRLLEGVNGDLGREIVEKTDILDKVVDYLGLKKVEPQEGEEGEEGFGDDSESSGFDLDDSEDEDVTPEEESTTEDEEPTADGLSDVLDEMIEGESEEKLDEDEGEELSDILF